VTSRVAYDLGLEPPAPVIPVRISSPAGEPAAMLPMLVDTGADCTLVPVALVRTLGLPRIDVIAISGVGGASRQAAVHAAVIELSDVRLVVRAVAFAGEAILGRDVLNQLRILLDGPRLELSATRPRDRKRSAADVIDIARKRPHRRRASRRTARTTRAAIERA
jgi:predicted aspartyl protease